MIRPKLSFFLSHPVQYISPLLKALAKKMDVKAYYFSDASIKGAFDKGFGQNIKWDIPLLEGYEYAFIKNYSRTNTLTNRFFELINPGVIRCIDKDAANIIVINGWMYFSVVLTILYGKVRGKQIWLRAENPLNQEIRKSKKVIFLKRLLLQYGLFKLVDKFLYIGSQNKSFFQFYGVKEPQLVYTPYSVNNAYFDEQFQKYKHDKEGLRNELGLPAKKKIILFTAKYIGVKRPLDLLKAFHQLKYKDALLVMVGDGALRGDMEMYIKENNLANVVLTGFVNQTAISKYYAASDVFVMCSGMGETWGLSVNEAMNFALPVIVSDTCGCSYDLVRQGQNGFTFKEGDVATLSQHIDTILTDVSRIEERGALSKKIMREFSIDTIVANMYAAAVSESKKQMHTENNFCK